MVRGGVTLRETERSCSLTNLVGEVVLIAPVQLVECFPHPHHLNVREVGRQKLGRRLGEFMGVVDPPPTRDHLIRNGIFWGLGDPFASEGGPGSEPLARVLLEKAFKEAAG